MTKQTIKKPLKRSATILSIVERIAKVNKKGVSSLIPLDASSLIALGCTRREASMFQCTNGVPYLRQGSLLCKKYSVQKYYKKNNGSLKSFRLTGFTPSTVPVSRGIPVAVRRDVLVKYRHKCVWCGSTDKLEVDHKNGRYSCAGTSQEHFQLLCKSCNDKKRERCKKCITTGNRYNVQESVSSTLYNIPFTKGTSRFNNKLGCQGCFLYDIEDFYKHNTIKHEVEVIVRPVKHGRIVYHKKTVI